MGRLWEFVKEGIIPPVICMGVLIGTIVGGNTLSKYEAHVKQYISQEDTKKKAEERLYFHRNPNKGYLDYQESLDKSTETAKQIFEKISKSTKLEKEPFKNLPKNKIYTSSLDEYAETHPEFKKEDYTAEVTDGCLTKNGTLKVPSAAEIVYSWRPYFANDKVCGFGELALKKEAE